MGYDDVNWMDLVCRFVCPLLTPRPLPSQFQPHTFTPRAWAPGSWLLLGSSERLQVGLALALALALAARVHARMNSTDHERGP